MKLSIALLLGVAACGGKAPAPPPAPAPDEPQIVAETPTTEGGLTRNDVDATIKANKDALRACYQRELAQNPEVGNGKVVVWFKIEPSGAVSGVTILETSTLESDAVETCIADQIRSLHFPPTTDGAVVSYPFLFSHG